MGWFRTAGILAVTATTVCLVSCSADQRPVTGARSASATVPSTSVDPSGVAPRADEPDPAFRPTTRQRPAPHAVAARACRAADLEVAFAGVNGAGGRQLNLLAFGNVGRATCILSGRPRVVASAPGEPSLVAKPSSFPMVDTAPMAPGASTMLGLETDADCAADPGGDMSGPDYGTVTITLPDGGSLVATQRAPLLNAHCGLYVTRFFVERRA